MKEITTYPALKDLTPSPLPPRTQLYNVPPIGVGTGDIESLTSFGTRAAASHTVASGMLFRELIGPAMIQLDPKTSRLHTDVYQKAWIYNGQYESLAVMTKAFEELTGRKDLGSLTFTRWSKVLSMRGIFRPIKAWCPYCYHERLVLNQTQYDPLIWTFNLVNVCVRHESRLITQCPNPSCRNTNTLLNGKDRIDRCSECDASLAIAAPPKGSERIQPDELLHQKFIVNQLSELLSAPDEAVSQTAPSTVTHNVVKFINRYFDGNVYRFSGELRFSLTCVFSWYGGMSTPSLPCLIHICEYFNVSLIKLLTDDETKPTCDISEKTRCFSPSLGEIRKRFIRILQSTEHTLLSLPNISDRLGYRTAFLKDHFPDLCRQAVFRYRSVKRSKKSDRKRGMYRDIRMSVIALMKNRVLPTIANVESMMFRPGLFKDGSAQEAFRSITQEFGLDHEMLSRDILNGEREIEIAKEYFLTGTKPIDCCDIKVDGGNHHE